jgi:glycosyltransferase involved in cell wall biosynthesis
VRIVLVSGIFPPDIGGPATHTSDLQHSLVQRGHRVAVLTLHEGPGVLRGDGVTRYPRSWPWPRRHAAAVRWLVSRRDRYDVVYASGMQPAAVLGARLAGKPVITKVVGDAAWERGRRSGRVDSTFGSFQVGHARDPVVLAMQALERAWIRRSSAVVTPSEYLRDVVEGWVGRPSGVTVIPNGVRLRATEVSATKTIGKGLSLLCVGRLVSHKRFDLIIEAVDQVADATLTIVGDGPERATLEALVRSRGLSERVAFRRSVPHEGVARLMGASDALVIFSEYEGLPHVAIEALSAGLPIVATNVGGTAEVLVHGENGLIVERPTAEGLAETLRILLAQPQLRERVRAGAAASREGWDFDRTADGVESLMSSVDERPRMVFLGKTRWPDPPSPSFARRLQTLTELVEPVLIHVGHPRAGWYGRVRSFSFPDLRPSLLGGAVFYTIAPIVALGVAARRRPSLIVCQSPFEGAMAIAASRVIPRSIRPKIVVEVHGDWRSASRLYGSPARSMLNGVSDTLAEFAIRRADRIRVIGEFTECLVRDVHPQAELERFIAHTDLEDFLHTPIVDPPGDERVLFVGALERYKGVDILLSAWEMVHEEHPDALLTLVGSGSLGSAVDAAPGTNSGVLVAGATSHERVSVLLDESRFLVLPSRSEGMGRVILEAFARERPVIGSRVGGIPELIVDGETGVLIPPDDADALAGAIRRALEEPDRMSGMGRKARQRAIEIDPDGDFEKGIRRLAEWAAAPWPR